MSRIPSLKEIKDSALFKEISKRAKYYVNHPKEALKVAEEAASKAAAAGSRGLVKDLRTDVPMLVRMLKSYISREYTDIPYTSLLKILIGICYFLFVADLIPDFIPVLGFMDDAIVIGWVIRSIRKNLDEYKEWEEKRVKGDKILSELN
jgi:uncharacterized membrane protein YkvA (DUF1232 family)